MNTVNYFSGCQSVEEIKKVYRSWAFKLHPDHGGDLDQMKELNRQYEIALKGADGAKSYDEEGTEHTYYYNEEIERRIVDTIFALLSLKMEGVDVLLIGTWVWIVGDSRAYKDSLKALGCLWHSKRKCWYFRAVKSWGHSSGSLSDLAYKYGVTNCKEMSKDYETKKAKKAIK